MSTLPLFDRPGIGDDEGSDEARGDEREDGRILHVGEVNRIVRASIEGQWPDVWIEGELSDVKRAASGHVYFCLNDEEEQAQLRGVMFRSDARRAKARLERGEVVRMRGGLTIFEPRGSFQLIARTALPAGEGDLHAQFERVRRKLEAEGLLDPARKRRLPSMPSVVGVVTSASGAAMHDIIRVAAGRCPVRIVVSDCRVQGQEAPASIVRALSAIQRLTELDVVIVGRGGGAQEDLWAFNHESVARAIAECRVPTVSAVGHEVDVTIADLVADLRASTPSNAAELVVPDRQALVAELDGWTRRVERALDTRLGKLRLRLERMDRRLSDPRHGVAGVRRRLHELQTALARTMRRRVAGERNRVTRLTAEVARHDARRRLAEDRRALLRLQSRVDAAASPLLVAPARRLREASTHLRSLGRPLVDRPRARLDGVSHRLEALSPRAVLARGYAIVLREGRALVSAGEASPGDRVEVLLHTGKLGARVEDVEDPEGSG